MPLAPYATHAAASRGRLFEEPASALRSPFQRDRDRIIHSGAFRKLRNKTQVFVEFEGDFYRTRLTHSLEVAQIARSISRALSLDEDLTEAIALAHDLGHTCFGHIGEEALDDMMTGWGGFDHNDQTFRILTALEQRYPAFDGLNLTWETLEGVVKHNGPLLPLQAGRRLPPTIAGFQQQWNLELDHWCGLEAQVAALADDIAYNTHDVDDGVRAGLLAPEDVAQLPVFADMLAAARQKYPDAGAARLVQEAVRQTIGALVEDVLTTTKASLAAAQPADAGAVRTAGRPLVVCSPAMQDNLRQFRAFLMQRLYRHPRVNRLNVKAGHIVRELFRFYMHEPDCLPPDWSARIAQTGKGRDAEAQQARIIADYIAGMTDRYAVMDYQRLFSVDKFI